MILLKKFPFLKNPGELNNYSNISVNYKKSTLNSINRYNNNKNKVGKY